MTKPVMLTESAFCPHSLNKYASLMTTGNGYMGIRASHEEDYTLQTRGMYLAGLYHRAGKGEINELVNLPDVVGVEISLNGEIFSLSSGVIESWHRELVFCQWRVTPCAYLAYVWRSAFCY
jgi:Trehalose and maltose hydrolases (possible phosphorylases)